MQNYYKIISIENEFSFGKKTACQQNITYDIVSSSMINDMDITNCVTITELIYKELLFQTVVRLIIFQ